MEKRLLTGGIDSDSDIRFIAQGDYRYALNVHAASSDKDSFGAVEDLKGNTLVEFTLPRGDNKVIGSFDDKTNKKVYYFVWNEYTENVLPSKTEYNHGIYEYNYNTNTIKTVLKSSLLKFDKNYLITGIVVVNGLLYWTDDNVEPRKINIQKGILHSEGDYVNGYPNPFREEYIYQIKTPPHCEPAVVYENDFNKNVNYLQDTLFQFKYRFIYDDGEKSAWSPISEVPFPNLVCGDASSPSLNNNIAITVETGSPIALRIEIAARIGNIGDFFSIIDLTKKDCDIADDSTFIYHFYNEKVYNFVDINESIKLFDSVPLKAKALEFINGSRIAEGNILEGFDQTKPDIKINVDFEDETPLLGFSFSGDVFIRNFYDVNDSYHNQIQPIFILDGKYYYGGIYSGGAFDGVVNRGDEAGNYLQEIPLGGFTFYLAGTPYYATSYQVSNTGTPSGYFDITDSGRGETVGSNMRDLFKEGDTYNHSTFTFSNVPSGKYILRMASNLITRADLDSPDRRYQKTSGNVISIAQSTFSSPYPESLPFEALIEITKDGNIYCNNVLIGGSGSKIPTSEVLDVMSPTRGLARKSIAIFGYLKEKDIDTATKDAAFNDTSIHLARIAFSQKSGAGTDYISDNFGSLPVERMKEVMGVSKSFINQFMGGDNSGGNYTDHNGYFFWTTKDVYAFMYWGDKAEFGGAFYYAYDVNKTYLQGGNDYNIEERYDYFTGASLGADPQVQRGQANLTIYRNARTDAFVGNLSNFYTRTLVSGEAKYKDQAVSGILINAIGGGHDVSDFDGKFSFFMYQNVYYADKSYNIGGGLVGRSLNNGNTNNIIFGVSDNCIPQFERDSDRTNIAINEIAGTQTNFLTPYNSSFAYRGVGGESLTIQDIVVIQLLGDQPNLGYKRGGSYSFGLVYYDHANRSSTTNITEICERDSEVIYGTTPPIIYLGSQVEIPFYTEINPATNAIYAKSTPVLKWEINNPPPIWATHYQWVRTLNASTDRYIQWIANSITFVNDFGNGVSAQEATQIKIDLSTTLIAFSNRNPESPIKYDYSKGDRIRFIRNGNGVLFDKYLDVLVKSFSNGYIFCEMKSGLENLTATCLFEVYSPKLRETQEIYYEFSQCFEIGNAGTATRYHKKGKDFSETVTAQDQTSSQPATGWFDGGDTYYKLRKMPTQTITSGGEKVAYVEDANFSDFYSSKVQDIGRPNKVDKDAKQIRRPTTIYYSQKYIPETSINGLSSFFDTSFEQYDRRYGSIQKLYSEDDNLIMFQELKIGSILVNKVVYNDVRGGNTVGASENVLNTQVVYYGGEIGIGLHPESFAVYNKSKYGYDVNRGMFWRLGGDGLTPISEYKLHNFTTDISKEILKQANKVNVYGAYDMKFNEYIACFEYTTPYTLTFNELANRWTSFYSFAPENICSAGIDIVSFKDGALWLHNSNETYNNFYGVQSSSEIHVPSNENPSNIKFFKALQVEATKLWNMYEGINEFGQKTELQDSDWEEKEGVFSSSLLRDINTPNIDLPLLEGDLMRCHSMLVKLKYSGTEYAKVFAVNINHSNSERTNR